MTQCAHFPKVGSRFDQWLDVGYWMIDLHHAPPALAQVPVRDLSKVDCVPQAR